MNILLMVTGGIASYKSIDLANKLVKEGNDVRVVLTDGAREFVKELPFETLTKNRVYTDIFKEHDVNEIQHIDLGKWADKILVAPATANTIAKISVGIADNLVTNILLALDNFEQVYVAPAMNTKMYNNPLTQKNINVLKNMGYKFIEPDVGKLACGDIGAGKFPEIDKIINYVLNNKKLNKNILITAGPTKEFIDPFRCLTNPSSGKMGIALAEYCANLGAKITLITSVDLGKDIPNVDIIKIVSSNDMYEAVKSNYENADIIIKAAAVSDYTPEIIHDKKIKKGAESINIKFKKTKDILEFVGKNKKDNQLVIGFAAETNNILEYAKEKIRKKNLDYIIANDISKEGVGFASDENEVYIIDSNFSVEKINKSSKKDIAKSIIDRILK